MERDGTGQLSTIYTYGNQRINSESYNNLTGLYTYDGRGSVSAVIGSYGDFRASYWYDGLGNVKSQIHGYGAFGSGKKYYGYNAEQYNPVTGSQNLRNRQVNIRRQRFLTEDIYLGNKTDVLSINRYNYGRNNPLKYNDPSGYDYEYAIWLVNEKGAQSGPLPAYAGHAALILAKDDGKGEFYSYVGDGNDLGKVVKGKDVDGYLTTKVDYDGNQRDISLSRFFTGDGYESRIGVVRYVDTYETPNSFNILNEDTGKYNVYKDPYTYGVVIPITNEEGNRMHQEALSIRNNPGQYNLYNNNCNQIAQQILSAGGKQFDYSRGVDFNTMPNNVRNAIVERIKFFQDPNQDIYGKLENRPYWNWQFGTIEELGKLLNIKSC